MLQRSSCGRLPFINSIRVSRRAMGMPCWIYGRWSTRLDLVAWWLVNSRVVARDRPTCGPTPALVNQFLHKPSGSRLMRRVAARIPREREVAANRLTGS
jgi:hypothetical protein